MVMPQVQRPRLFCPDHHVELVCSASGNELICPSGCTYPILDNIPRFVPPENYSSSFGLQWNTFRKTQLDSENGLSISRDRLTHLMGGSLDGLWGKSVLEAGCGAGRFTEILLDAGACVLAADLSSAVEANYQSCSSSQHYSVCQADILKMPVDESSFDFIICIGVIQHTPDPEQTIAKLCTYVKEGGMLVIDHYSYGYPQPLTGRIIRNLCIRLPSHISMRICSGLTTAMWPIHASLWKHRRHLGVRLIRSFFLKISPVVDYHDAYPQLDNDRQFEWALLDTHDTLTDAYKHLRTAEEIRATLEKHGMKDIEVIYAGNGVEARAFKPMVSPPSC